MNLAHSDTKARLYRIEAVQYAPPVNEFDEPCGEGRTEIVTRAFPVTKYTPKGAWIDCYGESKFINLRATKQFACASLDEAKTSFAKRKERQIKILKAQLRLAERQLRMLNGTSLGVLA